MSNFYRNYTIIVFKRVISSGNNLRAQHELPKLQKITLGYVN